MVHNKFEGGIMMQPLTKVMQGATCTVKWALGLPDIVEKLHALKIDQGSKLKVICKNRNDMIIGDCWKNSGLKFRFDLVFDVCDKKKIRRTIHHISRWHSAFLLI